MLTVRLPHRCWTLLLPLLLSPVWAQTGAVSVPVDDDALAEEEAALIAVWEAERRLDRPVLDALLLAQGATEAEAVVVRAWLSELLAEVTRKVRPRHSAARQARTIHRLLHREALDAFDAEATLVSLATDGTYNLPLAAIVFGLAADHVGLPYQLHHSALHLFLTVPSDEGAVRIEAFDDDHGFEAERHTEDVVQVLDEFGLLNPITLEAAGLDPALDPPAAYRTLVADAQPIDLAQSLGILYGIDSAFALQDNRLLDAIEASRYALVFLPGSATYQRNHTLFVFMASQSYCPQRADEFVVILRDAMDFRAGDPVFAEILPALVGVTAAGLLDEFRDFEQARALILDARGQASLDEEGRALFDEVEALTYTLEASIALRRGDLDTAQQTVQEAFLLQPDDIAIKEDFIAITCDVAMKRTQRGDFAEAEALLTPLLAEVDAFPIVGEAMARVLTGRVVSNSGAMLKESPDEARLLMLRARDLAPDLVFVSDVLAGIYHEEAMQLVRDGNYPEALAKAREGLEAVPNNRVLLDDIAAIEPYVD